MIKSIRNILFGVATFITTLSQANAAVMMSYWDSSVINDTEYSLKNLTNTKDEAGFVTGLYIKDFAPHQSEKAYSLSTNYLGHLSQDLQFDVYNSNDIKVGYCVLHSGLGSYLTLPNFNGSKCTLDSNYRSELNEEINLIVNPVYAFDNNHYQVSYKISKDKNISRIILFGDSLSDMGNLYRSHNGALPKSPPYFQGHFSDGEIWIEHFAKHLNIPRYLISNYAYGGASITQTWRPVYGLEKQIGQYLTWNPTADENALYVVWIGSNDFVYGVSGPIEDAVDQAAYKVEEQLRLLISHGAKNFLLPNLPNFAISPVAHDIDKQQGGNDFSTMLTSLASEYNKRLAKVINKLGNEFKDVTFASYDTFSLLEYAIKNYKHLGFKNNIDRCNPNGVNDFSQKVCSNPFEYVFWDDLHPTSHTHAILAREIFKAVEKKGFKPNTVTQAKALMANVDEISYRNMQAIDDLNERLIVSDAEPLGLGFLNREYTLVSKH